jgi:hypothetical protein
MNTYTAWIITIHFDRGDIIEEIFERRADATRFLREFKNHPGVCYIDDRYAILPDFS